MIEVYYKEPVDPDRENRIVSIVSRFNGVLDFHEKSDGVVSSAVIVSYEFDREEDAAKAAAVLRNHGEHVEGPYFYGWGAAKKVPGQPTRGAKKRHS